MSDRYSTHRRVNAPLEFKGLKGQYIFYAGGLLVGELLFFALLYLAGLNSWICLIICFGSGIGGIGFIYRLSYRYGIHGWRKRQMARRMPKTIRIHTRTLFFNLSKRNQDG